MPPWVARQWHVWRPSRRVSGHLLGPQPTRGPVHISCLRFYAQSSPHHDQTRHPSRANSAIIIPSSVANTRPEDLIAHIEPVQRHRLAKDRFAVFFVTPSFATWLLDDRVFLHKALRQAYAHSLDRDNHPYTRVHALCAVVHKLPIPKSIDSLENIEEAILDRTRQPPVLETGHEGIAYATLPFSDSIPTESVIAKDKAAVSLVASERSGHGGYVGDTLRLPLANTVFQTGSPTTMIYSTWGKAKGANDLTLKAQRHVTHHGIRIEQNISSRQYASALSVPLMPLTLPRQVEAGMGNILRRVIGPDGTSVTASQELESKVPQFFNSRGKPPQATTVWALVMNQATQDAILAKTNSLLGLSPTDTDSDEPGDNLWQDLWKHDPPLWGELVPTALASGARLHRVLSGGGGWGKKAGLLSLDPVAATGEEDFPDDPHGVDMSDGPGDLSSALQQVARDGDYIQFFISPSTTTKEDTSPGGTQNCSHVWGWEFGTIPSTSDSMPVAPGQHEASKSNDVSVFRHSFGALAEGGMILNRNFKLKSKDSYSVIGGSTIDVPFSRFSALTWRTDSEEKDMEEDSIHNCLDSKPIPYHRDLVNRLYGEEAPPFAGLPRLQQGPKKIRPVLSANRRLVRPITAHPPPRILYTKLSRDQVAYCVDKLRRLDRVIGRLTTEYRTLMHHIRLQNGLPMKGAFRENSMSLKIPPGSTILRKMTEQSERVVSALQSRTRAILDRIAIEKQVKDITATVSALRHILHRLLAFRLLIKRLTRATNTLAVDIYELHIQLRWQLGTMIMARQNLPALHTRRKIIHPLENHLVHLRVYRTNLFVNNRTEPHEEFIAQRLSSVELSHPVLRALRLSASARNREHTRRISAAEQRADRINAAARHSVEARKENSRYTCKIRAFLSEYKGRDDAAASPRSSPRRTPLRSVFVPQRRVEVQDSAMRRRRSADVGARKALVGERFKGPRWVVRRDVVQGKSAQEELEDMVKGWLGGG